MHVAILHAATVDSAMPEAIEQLLEHGACVIAGLDEEPESVVMAAAAAIGTTDLGISVDLSGPPIMHLRFNGRRATEANRPAYFTADAFGLHTDLSYVENPPRWLLTFCVSPDPSGGGLTTLASCLSAYQALPQEDRRNLASVGYIFPHPPGCEPGSVGPLPIYDGQRSIWRFRGDRLAARADLLSSAKRFGAALADRSRMLRLGANELLLLDNHRVAHGRTAFSSGSSRHLLRTYSTTR